ncbi:MAG: CC0125/CC1285 family lipoprotein [Asticcacaulis sp.]
MTLLPALFLLGTAAAVAPATVSAATPTYQAAGPKGGTGWTAVALPNGRNAVTYTGDSKMTKDQVAKFAFLRAAEYTQESGFEWFAVIVSTVRDVEVGSQDDMAGRTTGAFMGGTTASGVTGTGGGNNMAGNGGGSVDMGPSTSGFGGGGVDPSVLEHWQPRKVPQAVLIIQMGKGDQAKFEGLTKQPEIFDAKSTIDELRAPPAQ